MSARMCANILSTDPLCYHPIVAPTRVIRCDVMNPHVGRGPLLVERIRYHLLPHLIATAVADQRNIDEPVAASSFEPHIQEPY